MSKRDDWATLRTRAMQLADGVIEMGALFSCCLMQLSPELVRLALETKEAARKVKAAK